MDNAEVKQRNFTMYDYKEVLTESSRFSFLLDGYENFGWVVDEAVPESREYRRRVPQQKAVLRLKRDRKIINKVELTRLERHYEACVSEIEKLENAKTSAATMYALILGIFGTAFMAGATFATTAQPPQYIWCILLAVPGFLGWICPYFLYKKLVRRQTEKMTLLIEAKYDEIYEICEKGSKLLY